MTEFPPYDVLAAIIAQCQPTAGALMQGNVNFPNLHGWVHFYETPFDGIILLAQIYGLPDTSSSDFYGLYIHEYGDCTPPFLHTGGHYNPDHTRHPKHAGDLPPLLGNSGYAWTAFYTTRFRIRDVLGKSVVIHSHSLGKSDTKIGCGPIYLFMS